MMARSSESPLPPEEPHFTREWLLDALRHLRADFEAVVTGDVVDERAQARLAATRALGLDDLAVDALPAIDRGLEQLSSRQWPGGLELRLMSLIGGLSRIAEASSASIPHEPERADLTDLASVMACAEQAAASGLRRRAAQRLRGLYVIVDPDLTDGRDPVTVAEQAVLAGATAIQLRDKRPAKGDWLPLARRLVELCAASGAALIVNDHPDVAVAAGAHGVHLGQHDLPLQLAQRVLRPWQISGTSNALVDEARESLAHGADYIAVGRMFPTSSKSGTRPAGPETLRQVRELVPADGPPLVAIGGITAANVGEVASAGADGICVISAVTMAGDRRAAAERLLAAFREAR